MGLHVAQMTSQTAMRDCFDAVTTRAARILGLEDYGIAIGARADMVLLQAQDQVDAIRLRANRLAVIRSGRVIAQSPPNVSRLSVPGRPSEVRFQPETDSRGDSVFISAGRRTSD